MSVLLVIGGQWGDEGKAKIVDYLAKDADYVVRFQGGANAGHTVVVDGRRFAFHLMPAGVLYPDVRCVLAGGMVVDPIALAAEIESIEAEGIDVSGRVFVSEQAHLVLPYHIEMDRASETKLGAAQIGTTRKGIAPAYVDKFARQGIRVGDLRRPRGELEKLLSSQIRRKNRYLKLMGYNSIPVARTVEALMRARRKIQPLIADTRLLLWSAHDDGKNIIFEGAQGTLLDVDHGTYPFVTSSSVSVGGAVTGSGLPASAITQVIGIFKAYCTRVGNGPFPTEDLGEKGERLREIGGEYGTTTGRPRRCGWFDAVAARTAVKLNGVTDMVLTKLDVLDTFETIKVCTAYRRGKQELRYFPTDASVLERYKPVYETLDGWLEKTKCREESMLPAKTSAYIRFLETQVGCKIHLVSLGPERDAVVELS